MSRFLIAFAAILATTVLMSSAFAQQYARWAGGGVVIRGYDTTAYFRRGRPAQGGASHTVSWNGAKWRFQTAKEAALFRANPSAYQPQFGAYCTGGLSHQHVVNGNPRIWRMHKGKLYMFFAHAGARRFDRNPEGVIAAARAYAKKVGVIEN